MIIANQILIIDVDKDHSGKLKKYLSKQPCPLTFSSSVPDAITKLDNPEFDIIIACLSSSEDDLSQKLLDARKQYPYRQYIICSSAKLLNNFMELFSSDALAYLKTPVDKNRLILAVVQAQKIIRLQLENKNYSEQIARLDSNMAWHNQLFEEVPCYISVQDKDLKITRVNKRFKAHFGEKIGGYCYKVYKHRDSQCPDCPVVQTFNDGESHNTEETVTSLHGKQYNVLTQTAPIKDENGDIIQVMELSTNITQIRQLQDHLASLGLMLGSMVHGVKGTLTALDGGIYQLETGLEQKDDAKISSAFERIKSMTDKIKKMSLEILDYAKSRELHYENISVDDLVSDVVETITPLAQSSEIEFTVKIPENLGEINVDAGWMAAALVNFLENGVEACQADTDSKKHSVRLDVRKNQSNQIEFVVSDNGIGMDQATKEKMFSLFFTSKGAKGTGLGMFISSRIIHYHGGSVEANSTKGQGSCFTIRIPEQRPETNQAALLYDCPI